MYINIFLCTVEFDFLDKASMRQYITSQKMYVGIFLCTINKIGESCMKSIYIKVKFKTKNIYIDIFLRSINKIGESYMKPTHI